MIAVLLLLAAAPAQYEAPAVPDPELAEQRGGFRLPSGIDVAITVQTQTAVNGAVVLASVFRADQGAPTVTAYAPKPGETVAAAPPATSAEAAARAPSITYDSRNEFYTATGGDSNTAAGNSSGRVRAVLSPRSDASAPAAAGAPLNLKPSDTPAKP